MKKLSVFLFLGLFLSLLNTEARPYKAHFAVYTSSLYDQLASINPTYTDEEVIGYMMNGFLAWEVRIKKAMLDTDPGTNAQWVYFGPYKLGYNEQSQSQTNAAIYGALTTNGEPLKRGWDSLKSVYNLQTVNPYMMTLYGSWSQTGGNIFIPYGNANLTDYAAGYLNMVNTRGSNHTLTPMYADFPEEHPMNDRRYGTLGTISATWIFPVFAHKDSTLVYYNNGQDSVYFPLGDDDHNVLDPTRGWDLSTIFDRGQTSLNYETVPDTLTLKTGTPRYIELYPGWNDTNTGDVLYITGGRLGMYNYETHIIVYDNIPADRNSELYGYAVELTNYEDAFALEYILVQFEDNLTVPSLSAPTEINPGENFTITLTGTPQKMTSWTPSITIEGAQTQFISRQGFTYTYRALESGDMRIILEHKSLLVLDPDTLLRTVSPTPPQNLSAQKTDDGVQLTWTDSQTEVTYTVYRHLYQESYGEPIATELTNKQFVDTTTFRNQQVSYVVTAVNSGGESNHSNEQTVFFAPDPPTDLSAEKTDETTVKLIWTDDQQNVSYTIYRKRDGTQYDTPLTQDQTSLLFTDNVPYRNALVSYVVTAVGIGGESEHSNEQTVAITPLPPSNVRVEPDENRLRISWDDDQQNVWYRVYRHDQDGVFEIPLVDSTDTKTVVDPTTRTNVIWYYTATAFGIGGESTKALPDSIAIAPDPPSDLIITDQKTSVKLEWTDPQQSVRYTIYRRMQNGSYEDPIVESHNGKSYTDNSAFRNQVYYYTLKGTSFAGESELCEEQKIVLPPASPKNLVLSRTEHGIELTWEDNQPGISYSVYRRLNGEQFEEPLQTGILQNTFVDNPTEKAVVYIYGVKAVSNLGASPFSNLESIATAPGRPQNLTLERAETGLLLSWEDSQDNVSYTVYRRTSGQSFEMIASGQNQTQYVDTDPLPNGEYFYVVTAIYREVESPFSDETSVILGPPTAPQKLILQKISNGIALDWTDTQKWVSYSVYRKTETSEFIRIASDLEDSYYLDQEDLDDGKYFYVITAVNDRGESEYSEQKMVEIFSAQGPESPHLQSVEKQDDGIYLTWSDDQQDVSYSVYRRKEGEAYTTALQSNLSDFSYLDEEALPDGVYYYAVTAVNTSGESAFSQEWKIVLQTVGITDAFSSDTKIIVYPNPAQDYIEIPEAYGTIAIYSNLGIKVMEINNPNGRIDISRLPAGVYYISINGRFEKFVKI